MKLKWKTYEIYICWVDCTHANTGLFFGIFVMVATIIALVVFFVLIDSEDDHLHNMAISVASLTELSLYSLTTIAVLIGIFQVSSNLYFNQQIDFFKSSVVN